mmetsp:Transcript_51377/g.109979  ORF Transcript_51377/g.109979 Transcript_51377/m.109979 type:complete len:207 (+) Transcript_51377:485-1105(+)
MPECQAVVVPDLLLMQSQGAEVAAHCLVEVSLCLLVLPAVHQDLPCMVERLRVSFLRVRCDGALVRRQGLVEAALRKVEVGEVELRSARAELLEAVHERDLLHGFPVQDPPVAKHPPYSEEPQQRRKGTRTPGMHPLPTGPLRCQVQRRHGYRENAQRGDVEKPLRDEGAYGEEEVHHRKKAEYKDGDAKYRPLRFQPPRPSCPET